MAVVQAPDEAESYLFAILSDETGVDQAEFLWLDEEQEDGCFRLFDYQWYWFTRPDTFQADQAARSVGKSLGITLRGYAFPFVHPGQEMVITAPELNHLRPLTDNLEYRITSTRLSNEMLPKNRGRGMARQPHWQVRFANGAKIHSRLPNKDGRGVKGIHPLWLELDEAQDYPLAGWVEIIETLKRGSKGAFWRIHGVPRGVRDKFYELTQPGSEFRLHRIMAMHRPSWSREEREEKLNTYGGSRQNPDYRRNVYGDHGDATNPVFVLSRLMAVVDLDEGSEYNTEVYSCVRIIEERLHEMGDVRGFLTGVPGVQLHTWEDAPHGYSAYWVGMDVGLTHSPSEILVFGQRAKDKTDRHDLLTRIHMQRIEADDQIAVIDWLFEFYGERLKGFAIDAGGLGFPIYQQLKRFKYGDRVHGWKANEKVPVGFEDRELKHGEEWEDLVIEREYLQHSTDVLRNDFVDAKRILLPYDREVLTEFQGQNYVVVKSSGGPYASKRQFSEGTYHTLDAARLFAAVKTLPPIYERLNNADPQRPVLDIMVDGGAAVPAAARDRQGSAAIFTDYGVF